MSSPLFWLVLEPPIQVPLMLAVLAPVRTFDPAFSITALAFNLSEAAFVPARLVYSQGAGADQGPKQTPRERDARRFVRPRPIC